MSLEFNLDKNEDPEAVDEIVKKTEVAFNSGDGDISNYYFSPEERLNEYLQFE